MAYTTRRIGVVLFQLGGPDTLEAIEPFLLICSATLILLTSLSPASAANRWPN